MVEIIGEDGLNTVLPHIKKVLRGERAEYESEIQYQGVGKRWLHTGIACGQRGWKRQPPGG